MKKEYLKELTNELNKHNVADKDEIIEKYSKRYDFGLESELSEEEIENMLGNPKDIVKKYIRENEEDIIDFTKDDSNNFSKSLIVKTLSDDISISYANVDEIETSFEGVDKECYNITEKNNVIRIEYFKRKFFNLYRSGGGKINIVIPKDYCFDKIEISTTSGDMDLDSLKANSIKVSMVSGDCDFTDFSAKESISCTSVSGDFTGTTLDAQEVFINLVSGDIEIENVYAKQLNIDTVSGDVDIAYTNASVKTTAISADVNVGKEKN